MLLAIDTATAYAGLALHDGLRVRAECTWESARRHTVELLPRLTEMLEQLGLTPAHLTGLAVTRGPGSFTGLRVGLAVAKGLALTCRLPLVGVPTLDVLAAAQGRDRRPLCAVLQAGRSRLSVAFYRWRRGAWRLVTEPYLTTWPLLTAAITTPTLFCGEIDQAGADALAALGERAVLLPPAAGLRRPGFLAELGWRRLRRGESDDPASLTPIYLNQPVR